MYSFLWNSASFSAALNTETAEIAQCNYFVFQRIQQVSGGEAGLTISHQHQGALGFGLAIMDLDGVGALTGSGEIIYRHLDNSCCHVVADLVSLREIQTLSEHY